MGTSVISVTLLKIMISNVISLISSSVDALLWPCAKQVLINIYIHKLMFMCIIYFINQELMKMCDSNDLEFI